MGQINRMELNRMESNRMEWNRIESILLSKPPRQLLQRFKRHLPCLFLYTGTTCYTYCSMITTAWTMIQHFHYYFVNVIKHM